MRTKMLAACLLATALAAGCARGSDDWDAWTLDTGTETTADTGWDTGYDPGWDPGYDPGWDPGTDPGADPGTDPGTDPGSDCLEDPCGLLPNCGCPTGQKCYTNVSSTTFVRECTTAGSGTSSSLCTGESSCAIETQCLVLFGESTPTTSMCYDFCNSETDCPGDASVCLSYYTTDTYPRVCSHACSPITNSGCPSTTKCQLLTLTSTDQDLTDCTGDLGYGSAGSACTVEADCGIGTFCATSIGECIAMCSWPSGSECSYLETCTPFEDDLGAYVTLDGVTYGYCI